MGEYASKKRTQGRGQVNNAPAAAEMTNGIPNSVMQDVFAGKRRASSEMMGHREELAPSIAAKMSQAFGMDLGGMQVYRSDAMAGSEMRGMASGNKVVLSSDVDLNTMEGQAILGHEISHIRAQSQGIGTGNSGLLQNAALEHQADAEGMMAARGMSISGESMGMNMGLGMTGVENLTPLSGGMSASAGAPMQAKKHDDENAAIPDAIEEDATSEYSEDDAGSVYDEDDAGSVYDEDEKPIEDMTYLERLDFFKRQQEEKFAEEKRQKELQKAKEEKQHEIEEAMRKKKSDEQNEQNRKRIDEFWSKMARDEVDQYGNEIFYDDGKKKDEMGDIMDL